MDLELISKVYNSDFKKLGKDIVSTTDKRFIVRSINKTDFSSLSTYESICNYFLAKKVSLLSILGDIEKWKEAGCILYETTDLNPINDLRISKAKVIQLGQTIAQVHTNHLKDLAGLSIASIDEVGFQNFQKIKSFFTDQENIKEVSKRFSFVVDSQMLDLQESHLEKINEFSKNSSDLITLGFTCENLFYKKGENNLYLKLPLDLYFGNGIWDLAKTLSTFCFGFPNDKYIKFKKDLISSYEKGKNSEVINQFLLEGLIIYFDLELLYKLVSSRIFLEDAGNNFRERLLKKLNCNHFLRWH